MPNEWKKIKYFYRRKTSDWLIFPLTFVIYIKGLYSRKVNKIIWRKKCDGIANAIHLGSQVGCERPFKGEKSHLGDANVN